MKQGRRRNIIATSLIVLVLALMTLASIQVSGVSAESDSTSMQNPMVQSDMPQSFLLPVINATPMAAVVVLRPSNVVKNSIATPQLSKVGFGSGGGNLGGMYDDWYKTPQPNSTPIPPASGGVITSITASISNVFHHLVFPVQTISDALLEIFNNALKKEQQATSAQEEIWIAAFSALFQPPAAGVYTDIANGGLKVAAGIAVALFVLRLAIYNWNRLLGDDDSAVKVAGDWVTAGILAIVAGPLLDLINRIGWWIMGVVLGNAASLAKSFADGLVAPWDSSFANTTFIGPIITIALLIASMLAIIGIIVAFASGHAVMYVLAAIGPTMMVSGVIPKIRWLRGMWFQAVVVVALLPVAAAAVFKAGIEAAASLNSGIIQEIFRVLWLFGITGFLLSISGILGKFTLGAAGDAFGKVVSAGKAIIESAVLAGSAIATGGASAAAGGAGALAAGGGGALGGGGGAAALGGGAAKAGSGAIGGFSATQHLQNAQASLGNADVASSLGMDRLASHYQRQAQGSQIAARQADIESRIGHQSSGSSSGSTLTNFGYTSDTVNNRLAQHYPGPGGPQVFNNEMMGMRSMINDNLLSNTLGADSLVVQHTDDMLQMLDAWRTHAEFAGTPDALHRTMDAANVSHEFRSLFRGG